MVVERPAGGLLPFGDVMMTRMLEHKQGIMLTRDNPNPSDSRVATSYSDERARITAAGGCMAAADLAFF
jgi:hypothetical protein